MNLLRYIEKPTRVISTLMNKGKINFLCDRKFLKLLYRINFGKKLNLDNPQSFNEKMQWLKLYDRNPIYTTMVDKYEVKQYVADKIGEEYIIPTLGVWDKFEDIDFDKLPQQFVLKCTHDSGGLVICRDKSKLDIDSARKKITRCLERNYFSSSREWPYKNVKPRIIAEKFMQESDENELTVKGLVDYKFFCFNGAPEWLYISKGLENHSTARISFFDLDGKEMPFRRRDYAPFDTELKLPENYEQMKKIAEKLAKEVNNAFVRIDLYSINNNIYFSEITFSPCSGMIPFEPEEWDLKLGEYIKLPIND
ncbi:MAG: glycosyl transferase [Clostridia bacterium]|nr:glycosyl transferase [Clostridia bacterium]